MLRTIEERRSVTARRAPASSRLTGSTVTEYCRRKSRRLGARSACMTASFTGRSADTSPRWMVSDRPAANSRGPNNGPKMSAAPTVRRSRRFSRNSLRKTPRIAAHAPPAAIRPAPRERGQPASVFAWRLRSRASDQPLAGADETDERILQRRLAGARLDLGGSAAGDHLPVCDHHDFVAQCADFLHDV